MTASIMCIAERKNSSDQGDRDFRGNDNLPELCSEERLERGDEVMAFEAKCGESVAECRDATAAMT